MAEALDEEETMAPEPEKEEEAPSVAYECWKMLCHHRAM